MTGRMEAFLFHVRSQLKDQITANRMVADALCRKTKTHNFDPGFSQQIRKTLWQARQDGSKGRYIFKKNIGVGLSQMRGVGGEFDVAPLWLAQSRLHLPK